MIRQSMITGMGIQCSIADSVPSFISALQKGKVGIVRVPVEHAYPEDISIAALLQNFVLEQQLAKLEFFTPMLLERAKRLARRAPLPIQVSIVAALQAWQQAKLHEFSPPADRVGIVVACDNSSQRYQYELMQKFLSKPEYLSPTFSLHAFETDHVAVLSELLSIRGEGFVVAGASASGNVAILKASQLIQLGIVDVCVIVGALSDLSPLALQGFYNTGAMGGKRFKSLPNKACRPFDKSHEGFIYGQGCGCVILEAAESVKKRGIKPFAKLLGGALLLDGHSLPDPSEVGEIKVMTHCLELACIKPHEVDYINAHGSSSPLGDITEINAIKQVFSHEINKIWINSTKGLIGHCLFAAGVIEAIACVVQMQNNFIHPNINLVNAIDNICLFAPKQAMSSNIYIAMNNSFGFGGINSSLLLKKVD